MTGAVERPGGGSEGSRDREGGTEALRGARRLSVESVNALAEVIAKALWDAEFEEKASDAEGAGLTVVDDWWDDKDPGEQRWRINAHRSAAIAVLNAGYTLQVAS